MEHDVKRVHENTSTVKYAYWDSPKVTSNDVSYIYNSCYRVNASATI